MAKGRKKGGETGILEGGGLSRKWYLVPGENGCSILSQRDPEHLNVHLLELTAGQPPS
jgi:hypothetical protein